MIKILKNIKIALLENIKAILFLQFVAAALIITYYLSGNVRAAWDIIGIIRQNNDPYLAMMTTSICGGLIPAFMKKIFSKDKSSPRQIALHGLFWFYKGLEIALFYNLLALIVGNASDAKTVFSKTAIDEFVYTPLWGMPSVYWFYKLVNGESLRKTFEDFKKDYLQVIAMNWIIWIPAVSVVYYFPLAIQLPLQNVILVMWVILLTFFAKKKEKPYNL